MKNFYMNLALNEAWKYQFLTYPNPAVGCVILDKNEKILAIKAHEKAGCAHAELNAILNSNHNLKNSTCYVTLFPCNECAKAIIQSGIKKVVYLEEKYPDSLQDIASKKLLSLANIKVEKYNGPVLKFEFEEPNE